MNYLLHIIIRVRFVRTCAQNNNYNNNKENKKESACVCLNDTQHLVQKKSYLFFCFRATFLVHVGNLFSTPTKKFSYV